MCFAASSQRALVRSAVLPGLKKRPYRGFNHCSSSYTTMESRTASLAGLPRMKKLLSHTGAMLTGMPEWLSNHSVMVAMKSRNECLAVLPRIKYRLYPECNDGLPSTAGLSNQSVTEAMRIQPSERAFFDPRQYWSISTRPNSFYDRFESLSGPRLTQIKLSRGRYLTGALPSGHLPLLG